MPTATQWLTSTATTIPNAGTTYGNPIITGLSNGNILLAWVESGTDFIGTTPGTDIIARIIGPEGNPLASPFVLGTASAGGDETDFHIAATNDGGFIVVYNDGDASAPNQDEVVWQRHGSNGLLTSSGSLAIENSATESIENLSIAVNNDDNSFVVGYTHVDGLDTGVFARIVDEFGVAGAEFAMGENTTGATEQSQNATLSYLSNGDIVSVYEEEDAGVMGIQALIYHTDTGTYSPHISVVSGGSNYGSPVVAVLSNGRFVVSYANEDTNAVLYRVYTAGGSPVAGPFSIAAPGVNVGVQEVVAMATGGFMLTWALVGVGRVGQFFDGSGSAVDSQFAISGNVSGNNIGSTVDGRLLVGQFDGLIRYSIFDHRDPSDLNVDDYNSEGLTFIEGNVLTAGVGASTLTGSAAADTLYGSFEGDVIVAVHGNDSIEGGGGNDTINSGAHADTVLGQAGDDLIYGGGSADRLFGGLDDDTLYGGNGTDSVYGNGGNDSIVISGNEAADEIYGGTGLDTVSFATATNAIDVDLVALSYSVGGVAHDIYGVTNIVGSLGNDTLLGSNSFSETLDGGGGNDLIGGSNGSDSLSGGFGTDTVSYDGSTSGIVLTLNSGSNSGGTAQGDTIAGFEHAIGTDHNDDMSAAFVPNAVIESGAGNDTLRGFLVSQHLYGGGGSDLFITGVGDSFTAIAGALGDDTLDHSAATMSGYSIDFENGVISTNSSVTPTVSVSGIENYIDGSGSNVIYDRQGYMNIYAGDGDDTVHEHSNGGLDHFDLGDGNDVLFVHNTGIGGDTFNGGAGVDIIDFSNVTFISGTVFSLNGQYIARSGSSEAMLNFEHIVGSQGNDVINGSAIDNTIDAQDGADTMRGFAGNDDLYGGGGDDQIAGGTGNDWMFGGDGADYINGQAGTDSIEGGAGNDTLRGSFHDDTVHGGVGDDDVNGGSRNDLLFGGSDNDTVDGVTGNDTLYGGSGDDLMRGGAGLDELYGGGDNDTLAGGIHSDLLVGGGGDDNLQGQDGFDSLYGGTGNDTLIGGGHADSFYFIGDIGADQINDFTDNLDTLWFDASVVGSLSAQQVVDTYATVVGNHTVFDFGGGNTLTVIQISDAQVLVNDIEIFL